MLITIDTEKVTDQDLLILSTIFDGKTAALKVENDAAPAVEKATKKSGRRTNAQIAFDAAKEAHDADQNADTYKALYAAYNELKAKSPDDERVTSFAQPPSPEQATTENEVQDAEVPAEAEATESVDYTQLKELAASYVKKDRAGFVELLASYGGAKRLLEVPEDKYSEVFDEITKRLAA